VAVFKKRSFSGSPSLSLFNDKVKRKIPNGKPPACSKNGRKLSSVDTAFIVRDLKPYKAPLNLILSQGGDAAIVTNHLMFIRYRFVFFAYFILA
jgi:hypothetical protein